METIILNQSLKFVLKVATDYELEIVLNKVCYKDVYNVHRGVKPAS